MTKINNVPPALYIPAGIRSLFAEHEKLRVAESTARTAAHQLDSDQLDYRAKKADEAAIAEAVRGGIEPTSPDAYRLKLTADRNAADVKAIQMKVALESVNSDVSAWVAENTELLVAHEADVMDVAAADYAAAVEATLTARRAYHEALDARRWAETLAEGRVSALSWVGARYEMGLDTELRRDTLTHETPAERRRLTVPA